MSKTHTAAGYEQMALGSLKLANRAQGEGTDWSFYMARARVLASLSLAAATKEAAEGNSRSVRVCPGVAMVNGEEVPTVINEMTIQEAAAKGLVSLTPRPVSEFDKEAAEGRQ